MSVIVGKKTVLVPKNTSVSEIRRIARLDRGRPLVRAASGRNIAVSGEVTASEGDRYIVGPPFTKGS